MPKRTDIKKVLVIGSGPIVIGQAAEFDYAGTQACLALKEEGYEVVLVQFQPRHDHDRHRHCRQGLHGAADPGIRRQDHPLSSAPTPSSRDIGGQTGSEPGHAAGQEGRSEGVPRRASGHRRSSRIERAEDRELFKELCEALGEPVLPVGDRHYRWRRACRGRCRDRLSRGAASRPLRWAAPAAASPTTRRSCGR